MGGQELHHSGTVLPTQQPGQQHPQTALQLKLHTVADERGGEKHHGAAAQGIHVQKSLTTKALSADSAWVCKGGFPAGCHASNESWVLMWAEKMVNSPSLTLFHTLLFTSKVPKQLYASQHKAKSNYFLLIDDSARAVMEITGHIYSREKICDTNTKWAMRWKHPTIGIRDETAPLDHLTHLSKMLNAF